MLLKHLRQIHQSSKLHWVGNGFPVRSVFDYNGLGRELSPFLLLDYATGYDFPPSSERRGVEAHPHKGFETVTICYQGELEHRDSSGGGGTIGPGDVQWMTAGKGIIHEEFHTAGFTRSGGVLQMVQLWVNLRAADKSAPAGYQTLLKSHIPMISLPSNGGNIRVIAGDYLGLSGPAKTFTPLNLWDLTLAPNSQAELPIPAGHTTALLILEGSAIFENQTAQTCDLALFDQTGEALKIQSTTGAKILLMSGQPILEPVVGQGPFVMNTSEEIQQAFREFRSGEMGQLREL